MVILLGRSIVLHYGPHVPCDEQDMEPSAPNALLDDALPSAHISCILSLTLTRESFITEYAKICHYRALLSRPTDTMLYQSTESLPPTHVRQNPQ